MNKRSTSNIGHAQRGTGKRCSMQTETKENRISNTHIRKNRLQNKDHYKRQRALPNDQGINPRRRHDNYKYIYPI